MRVAHFSDIHVLSLRGVHPHAFLGKRIVGGANLILRRAREYRIEVTRALIDDLNEAAVDHIVCSGDVSNLSLAPEFEAARELLMGLHLPASEVTVVPGNHDCYTLGEAWRNNFSRVLSPFIRGDFADEDHAFPFVRLRGDLAVVALSTARPSAPLMAVGTLGSRQIRRAEALLAHPELAEKFRLVVLHHPPRSRFVHWHNRLTDGSALIKMLGRVGADLVIHGHLHRACREEIAGPRGAIPVIGVTAGSWICADPARRASYNIYQLEGGRLAGVERRRYDVSSGAFRAG